MGTMAISFSVENGYKDRFAPAGAKKAYLARITGRHGSRTFAREFLGRGEVLVDEPGLYEHRETDKKGRADDSYILVLDCPAFPLDGDTLRTFAATKEQAMKIARALGSGRRIDEVCAVVDASSEERAERTWEFVTPRQAETRQVAATIDAAVEACWAIIQALPEREAKKVLAQLKVRVSPPKAARAPLTDDAPVGVASDAAQDAGADPEQLGLTPTPVVGEDGGQ
jgi:hypothetical protein